MSDKVLIGRRLILCTLSGLTGLLLFLSDFPVHAWPLGAVALIPLLWGLKKFCQSKKEATLAGFFVFLFFIVPLAIVLKFPLLMSAGLGLYLASLWILLSLGIFFFIKWAFPWGALAAGGIVTLVEWIDFSFIPIFGTAQCFARTWSAAPWIIQFVNLVGITGLVFVLVSSQAFLVGILLQPKLRWYNAIALFALIAPILIYNHISWQRTPQGTIRVAAIGWTYIDLNQVNTNSTEEILNKRFKELFEEGVHQGARLFVTPEVAFRLRTASQQELVFKELSSLAKKHKVMLAIGYFDNQRNQNFIAFFDSNGKLCAEYAKTHLIPFLENYQAGDGGLVILDQMGVKLGSMICQDDNFTDLARVYGQNKIQVVAVPTNDWLEVKNYHIENSIFRAIENRYSIVRAASNGISAIISFRGEILKRVDHFDQGPQIIVADLPVTSGGTFYSSWGDWFVLPCLLYLVFGCALRRRGFNRKK